MRFILTILAPLAIAATAPVHPPSEVTTPEGAGFRENCRDRIELVREERGLPKLERDIRDEKLERDSASPDEALLIAAVDKRVDGCSVMVMRHDTSDIRPLPEFKEGPAQLRPAR